MAGAPRVGPAVRSSLQARRGRSCLATCRCSRIASGYDFHRYPVKLIDGASVDQMLAEGSRREHGLLWFAKERACFTPPLIKPLRMGNSRSR
jgi:hypothetical protein